MKVDKTCPLFSIVTCTMNSEKYLMRNIISVESQNIVEYEHLFIDGYSSDGTLDIIRDYMSRDGRVRLFCHRPRGVADAFNWGVRHARGFYLIFLNSDDYFFSRNSLKYATRFIERNGSENDWFYSKVKIINDNGDSLGFVPQFRIFECPNYFLLKMVNYIPHQGVFMKKDLFERYGLFDESVKFIPDYEYFLRVGNKTKWVFMDKITSVFTARKDSVSLNPLHADKLARDVAKFHRRYASFWENKFHLMINYGFLARLYRYVRYYR